MISIPILYEIADCEVFLVKNKNITRKITGSFLVYPYKEGRIACNIQDYSFPFLHNHPNILTHF